jgi:hypothetical protein
MINHLEESMRPGELSSGGFLGKDERLDDVLKADDETVKRLGLTHEKIADRIEYFIKAVGYPLPEGKLVDEKYLVGGRVFRGGQGCPWDDAGLMMPHSNVDMFVKNQELNETLSFPGGIVHLIREHHFYEGKQSPYRVDPEKAARVLDLI